MPLVLVISLRIARRGHRIDNEIRRDVATEPKTVARSWFGFVRLQTAVSVDFDRFIAGRA